jgi:hypothetical protein
MGECEKNSDLLTTDTLQEFMLLDKWSRSYDLAELYFAMYALYLQYQHLPEEHPRLLIFFYC